MNMHGSPWIFFWVFINIKINIVCLISHFQNNFLKDNTNCLNMLCLGNIYDTEPAITILHKHK